MMKDYIFLTAILLLRFPQSYFNKKTSGMVNGAAASACPHSASRRSARFRSR